MIYEDYNESFFQTLVVFPFVFKYGKRSNHKIYIEKRIAEKTSIDILLTPKKGNSNSVFLLEIKKIEAPGSINSTIKESLIQVFNKKYIDNALEKAELPENDHWESFHIRIIVFSPDDSDTKWTITIKELAFNKEKLQIACKTFEENQKKNETNEILIEFLYSDQDSILKYPN